MDNTNDIVCDICYHEIEQKDWIIFRCKHGMCRECIIKYLLYSIYFQLHCPICRECHCENMLNIILDFLYNENWRKLITICPNMIDISLKNWESWSKNCNEPFNMKYNYL